MYVVQVTSLLFLNKYFRTLLEFNKVAEIVEFLYSPHQIYPTIKTLQ